MVSGMNKVVHADPEIMHGTPVFAGTRVPVQNLWDYLEGGHGLEGFLEGYILGLTAKCSLSRCII